MSSFIFFLYFPKWYCIRHWALNWCIVRHSVSLGFLKFVDAMDKETHLFSISRNSNYDVETTKNNSEINDWSRLMNWWTIKLKKIVDGVQFKDPQQFQIYNIFVCIQFNPLRIFIPLDYFSRIDFSLSIDLYFSRSLAVHLIINENLSSPYILQFTVKSMYITLCSISLQLSYFLSHFDFHSVINISVSIDKYIVYFCKITINIRIYWTAHCEL